MNRRSLIVMSAYVKKLAPCLVIPFIVTLRLTITIIKLLYVKQYSLFILKLRRKIKINIQ